MQARGGGGGGGDIPSIGRRLKPLTMSYIMVHAKPFLKQRSLV